MSTVTARSRSVSQPRGGYIPINSFTKIVLYDEKVLHDAENIHSSLVGTAVDYLTRFMLGFSPEKAFEVSIRGAYLINMQETVNFLLAHIKGLDDFSIDCACKLAGFDVCYRSSSFAYKPVEGIMPDKETVANIRIMVERSLSFWDKYGPVIYCAPTFEGGYTETVTAGDGDYLTADTLWDFKVTYSSPTPKHTLQLLMYYILGKHSRYSHFHNINKIGMFNPRLNVIYVRNITGADGETIKKVENEVIGYNSHPKYAPKQYIVTDDNIYLPVEETMSVQDVCEETGFSSYEIYKAIHSGELKAYKKGRRYYITETDYEEYLEYLHRRWRNNIIVCVVAAVFFLVLCVLAYIYCPLIFA